MKLAFSTLGCPEWSFTKILDSAAEMGYSAIEIRGIEGKMTADEIPYFMPGRQQETKRMLADRNIAICDFGSSISFHETKKAAEMYDEGKRTIDVCANMGIPYVRVFGNNIPAGRSIEEAAEITAEGITRLCEYASGTDVGILLEVHGEFNTVEIMRAVIEKTRQPKFGVLWDVAHSDKVYGDDYMRFYETVRPCLKHVHIKDHVRENGGFRLCHVGDGDIPIHKIVNTILDGGYDGYFSLEWEKKWHPELPDCETEFPTFCGFMRS